MATIDDYYKMIEANNRAYKIIENTVGVNEISKIMAQIHSMPRVPYTPAMTLPTIPPAVAELQSNIAKVRGVMGNPLPIFHNTAPLYESLMPALTYIQANRPDLFEQVNAVLSGEIIVDVPKTAKVRQHKRKVNLHKAQGLMERSRNKAIKAYCSWSTLSKSDFSLIITGINGLISTVDEPLRSQLNILLFLVVIFFVDTHTANEGPSKNE